MTSMTETTDVAAAGPGGRRLKRSLGLWMATALVVGNMIGSGVFLLPASLAGVRRPISIVGWVLHRRRARCCWRWSSPTSARAYPATGGPYAYSRRAFGDFVGFQTAWGYWIAAWAGNAAIAVAFVGYLRCFWAGARRPTTSLAALVGDRRRSGC